MNRSGSKRNFRQRALVRAAALALLFAGPAGAQITLDGTLGPAGALTGPNYAIGAALGRQVGTNLFHSFGQFNVLTGQSATFSGPAAIQNIIGRVTGGTFSSIDGPLQSTIAGANLYLINPAGIAFGPNASLNIPGSFHASTASYLKLGASGRFDAANPAASVLTAAAPSAFGFIGAPAGIVVNRSVLQVPDGKGLSLIGGAITANVADLVAPGGRVDLASVASAGEISLAPAGTTASGVTAYGAVTLNNTFVVTRSVPGHAPRGISIRGGSLTLNGGSALFAESLGAERGGDITLSAADSIAISHGSRLFSIGYDAGPGGDISLATPGAVTIANSLVIADSDAGGNAGSIRINAGSLDMKHSALSAVGYGSGRGGDVAITATGPVGIASSYLATSTAGAGAGNLAVSGASLSIANSLLESGTSAAGHGGSITLGAPGAVTIAHTDILADSLYGDGDAGTIRISGASLAIAGSTVRDDTYGIGRGGDMILSATDTFTLSGNSRLRALTFGAGDGGNIEIRAGSVALGGGSRIDTGTQGSGNGGHVAITASGPVSIMDGVGIAAGTSGVGRGGGIDINASSFVLDDASISSQSGVLTTGRAGDININVSGPVLIANGSLVSTSSLDQGAGGDVNISAASLTLTGILTSLQARSSSFGIGKAGNIGISVSGPVEITDGAGISTGTGGAGDAGNIRITAGSLAVTDFGSIDSNTLGAGAGGRIDIRAQDVRVAGASISTSALDTGKGGSISIEAGGLVEVAVSGGTGRIDASTSGAGAGGDVTISADRVAVRGSGAYVSANTSHDGKAGSVTIDAREMRVSEGGQVSSYTIESGAGGAINIRTGLLEVTGVASDTGSASIITAETYGTGKGGTVSIAADTVEIRQGIISASSFPDVPGSIGHAGDVSVSANTVRILDAGNIQSITSGGGNAGAVVLRIAGALELDGHAGGFSSGISTATLNGAGAGGSIDITAGRIAVTGGAVIESTSEGAGAGGKIRISAGDILVSGESGGARSTITALSTAGADAGSISLTAPTITLDDRALVTTQATGTGNAGDITILAPGSLRLRNGAEITTQALAGDGGNVHITAGDLVYLLDSRITTSVGTGQGNGGNITIDPTFVVLDNSQIIANAFGGNGGNITIVSDFFLMDPDSLVQASSRLGLSGTVTTTAPNVNVTAGFAALASGFFDASLLLRESCAARAGRAANSFTGVGRGGLPEGPGQMEFSRYAEALAPSSEASLLLAAAAVPAPRVSCR